MAAAILALDYGTTALKAVLYDGELREIGQAEREWTYIYPRPGHIEYPAEAYWSATLDAMKELLARFGGQKSLSGISVTGQAETLIALDGDGRALGDAIVWLDTRAQEECRRFSGEIPARALYEATGNTGFDPVMPINKLCWIKRHEPERYARTRRFLLLKEYIVYRLTGRIVGEYSAQSCSGYFNITACQWEQGLLDHAGIDRAKLPELHDSQYVVGGLCAETMAATDLGDGVLVVNGMLDQCASGVGAGVICPGQLTETTGTVLAIGAVLDQFTGGEPDMLVLRHGLKRRFLALPNCSTAGVLLKWFRDEFCRLGIQYDEIIAEIESRGRSDSGLLLLPHFAGYLSPINNALARGVVYGLTLDTARADVAHAILEGVGFLLRENLELLERKGIHSDEIISLGGGARSALWLSIKANVCARPMVTIQNPESTALGCALNTAVALGYIRESDIPRFVRRRSRVEPESAGVERYGGKYAAYCALNERLGFNPADATKVIRA